MHHSFHVFSYPHRLIDHRLNIFEGLHGAIVIDDSYNANPTAMKAAIDLLTNYDRKRILVIGDMLELGATASEYHQEIGNYARENKLDQLFALGELSASAVSSFGEGAYHYMTHEALIDALKGNVDDNTVILIKGSLSMNMRKVVQAFIKEKGRE